MDTLSFIASVVSNLNTLVGTLAWPLLVALVAFGFKNDIGKCLSRITRIQKGEMVIEMVAPEEAGEQERGGVAEEAVIQEIVRILQRSPHSFEYFRENTPFQYTDAEFGALIHRYPDRLQAVRIIGRDGQTRNPGMRLRREYRQRIEQAIRAS